MVAVLGFWDLDWRQLNCFGFGRQLLLATHLFDIFNFATICCDLEVNWNILWLLLFLLFFLGELSKVLFSGTAIISGLWQF